MKCYDFGFFGKTCGECKSDADCMDGGCTPPNIGTGAAATCNSGEVGSGCENTAVCDAGTACGTVVESEDFGDIKTCGACTDNANCWFGYGYCVPNIDPVGFSGVRECAWQFSLPDGASCDAGEDNAACASGLCANVAILDGTSIGICKRV